MGDTPMPPAEWALPLCKPFGWEALVLRVLRQAEDERVGEARSRTFASYGVARFRLHQMSWVTSSLAMQMAQLARPWLAYDLSDSALMLGVAADRLPKRTVLLVSQVVLLGLVSVMAGLVVFDVAEV